MKKNKTKTPLLDLHGFKTDEVFDAIDKFIMMHKNKKQIHIMTGKGKGLVKKEAEKYLKLSGYPFKPLRMENGKDNPGILVIFTS